MIQWCMSIGILIRSSLPDDESYLSWVLFAGKTQESRFGRQDIFPLTFWSHRRRHRFGIRILALLGWLAVPRHSGRGCHQTERNTTTKTTSAQASRCKMQGIEVEQLNETCKTKVVMLKQLSIHLSIAPLQFFYLIQGLHSVLFVEPQTATGRDLILARHCEHIAIGLVFFAASAWSATARGPMGDHDRQLQHLLGHQHGISDVRLHSKQFKIVLILFYVLYLRDILRCKEFSLESHGVIPHSVLSFLIHFLNFLNLFSSSFFALHWNISILHSLYISPFSYTFSSSLYILFLHLQLFFLIYLSDTFSYTSLTFDILFTYLFTSFFSFSHFDIF